MADGQVVVPEEIKTDPACSRSLCSVPFPLAGRVCAGLMVIVFWCDGSRRPENDRKCDELATVTACHVH